MYSCVLPRSVLKITFYNKGNDLNKDDDKKIINNKKVIMIISQNNILSQQQFATTALHIFKALPDKKNAFVGNF